MLFPSFLPNATRYWAVADRCFYDEKLGRQVSRGPFQPIAERMATCSQPYPQKLGKEEYADLGLAAGDEMN
jgi:hypothetical protein